MDDALRWTNAWLVARHAAWLTGDCEGVCRFSDADEKGPAVVEILRWRALCDRRRARAKKVICDGIVRSAAAQGGGRVRVELDEHLRLLCELGEETQHEQRCIRHVLVWEAAPGEPVLAAHAQETESAVSPAGRDGAAPVGDTASGPTARGGGYDRIRAFQYAERWWNDHNPQFQNMGVDCTNFVSQVLYAGGFPMQAGGRGSGWWYRSGRRPEWSYSWAVADALARHLQAGRAPFRAEILNRPEDLTIGDVICYDWRGAGQYGHNTVVTGRDANGRPLVNAHTVNSHQRYYSYEDSYAWTAGTRYLFIHFPV